AWLSPTSRPPVAAGTVAVGRLQPARRSCCRSGSGRPGSEPGGAGARGGRPDPRAVIGIGVNSDWPPGAFPPELAGTMTSLREASQGRPVDRARLLDTFLSRSEEHTSA